MVNITLILLLLHYIGLYIFKPKLDTLNCGIGGYIGNSFNKYKFNILGLYNDSRGGDSCGVFVGNGANKDVQYGHGKTKFYKNFVESGGLKDVNLESPNFALLHCRKASVGGVSLETAQPVVIRDADNKIIFAMIHNGTLINYKELAIKYGVDFTISETDSQIFCKIVYKAGYDLLSEYEGAGAFVFWDWRDGNDTIKIFKGASLYYENDNDFYIERPLFCISEENSFWFSSMEESLSFINDTNANIINIKSNVLFTIKNGRIIGEDAIDRSKRKQLEKLAVNWEKQRELNKKSYGKSFSHEDYDDYDEAWNSYDARNFNNNSHSVKSEKVDSIVKPPYTFKNKIYFNVDGLYYINNVPCDGPIEATPAGYTDMNYNTKKDMYYFVSGVLMHSYFDYLCAKQFVNQNFGLIDDNCVEMYLAPYSPTPVPWIYFDDKNRQFIEFYSYNESSRESELAGAWFEPFFDFKRNRYIVRMGNITWHYEYPNSGSFYVMPDEKIALDEQILSGRISKNQLKKMIKNNLKNVYAKH